MEKCRRYAVHGDAIEKENCGLLLWGRVGTGKSYLAACIANEVIEKEVSVRMTNMAAEINYGFDGRNEYIKRLRTYRLLIVDDLGMEHDSLFAAEPSPVYRQIRSAMREGLIREVKYGVKRKGKKPLKVSYLVLTPQGLR